MANDSTTRAIGVREVQEKIAWLRKAAPQSTRNGVNEFAINVQAAAKQNITKAPAVDTGRLRASIKIETYSDGFAKRVGSDVKYAGAVENGSRPHFPPIQPIKEWCRRHGLPESAAYAIALKISRKGTAAKPFLVPAYEQERPKFEKLIRDEWAKLSSQLG